MAQALAEKKKACADYKQNKVDGPEWQTLRYSVGSAPLFIKIPSPAEFKSNQPGCGEVQMKLDSPKTALYDQQKDEEGVLSFFTDDWSLASSTTTIVYELSLIDYP